MTHNEPVDNKNSIIEKSIHIEVSESVMTPRRYCVHATFDEDPYVIKCGGIAYAEEGMLYKRFGIGDSLETSLKKATCEAIRKLKEEWELREKYMARKEELNKICNDHANKCSKVVK